MSKQCRMKRPRKHKITQAVQPHPVSGELAWKLWVSHRARVVIRPSRQGRRGERAATLCWSQLLESVATLETRGTCSKSESFVTLIHESYVILRHACTARRENQNKTRTRAADDLPCRPKTGFRDSCLANVHVELKFLLRG
jgi:hypothetical protein